MILLWLDGLRSTAPDSLALGFVVLSLQRILSHTFVYWDLGPDGMRERRYWRVKSVAWTDVTYVRKRAKNSEYLIVDNAQPGHSSVRSAIVAHPEDAAGFVAALHRCAPQASYEA